METLEQPTIETTEKLLIYSNDQEIIRLTAEVQTRADILNKIFSHGIKSHQVTAITASLFSIGEYVSKLQLEENEVLRTMHNAGIVVTAALPVHLQQLKTDLLSWYNYKSYTQQNKFEFLVFEDDKWSIDEQALEKFFVKSKYKIFINSDVIKEVSRLHDFTDYLEKEGAEPHQLLSIAFFNHRLTCDDRLACNRLPKKKFMIKLNWLTRER